MSLLFLGNGIYVLASRGISRVTLAFFMVCSATFFWQLAWAALFQVGEPALALLVVKFAYVLILFLPTTLYHFVIELTGAQGERRRLRLSYGAALALAVLLLSSDQLISGVHHYFFGYYPQAGPCHPLHLLQTLVVMVRALQLLYLRQRVALSTERARLRYCLVSLLIYFFASVDYLCNYGLEIYPPGVLLVAISMALIAQAMVRHNLLANPLLAAATIAHEIRTPLLTIRAQARLLKRHLPELIAGYQHARRDAPDTAAASLQPCQLAHLLVLAQEIDAEVTRSNFIVDMMLASARIESLDKQKFALHSIKQCVDDALARYPFDAGARAKVARGEQRDFWFYGSDVLLVYVLYNLLQNALYAIQAAGRGIIEIAFYCGPGGNRLLVTDTGNGIPRDVLPHVFDPFFTTRPAGGGTGMGLAFCHRVLTAFGGSIRVESEFGHHTTFSLEFPKKAVLKL
ncbi:sensor histidine kinase [Janthinobacterium agaricidamnosum]|uniref:sensor histidine kinase n=1 Tax=Janthinobacterium agaricidamnosum TaxID=55508 RepID=UPI001F59B9AB|nr:sensor histidine kinase [Janthinobacterium agaricidamnosum]